jgi:chromosome partitioning protein
MLRADLAHYENIAGANNRLAKTFGSNIDNYTPVKKASDFNIGTVEDMNVLIQNSLWQNIPASKLDKHQQVKNLTGDKQKWSVAQLTLIKKVSKQIESIADRMIADL